MWPARVFLSDFGPDRNPESVQGHRYSGPGDILLPRVAGQCRKRARKLVPRCQRPSDLAGDGKSLRSLNGPDVGRDGIGIVAAESEHWHVRVAGH